MAQGTAWSEGVTIDTLFTGQQVLSQLCQQMQARLPQRFVVG